MKGVLKLLEPRVIIAVGVALLLLAGTWAGAWLPINRRLSDAERSLSLAEARLDEARKLVDEAGTLGLSTADAVARAIRGMEALIPDDLDDLEVARLVSANAIVNGLLLEQWDALPSIRIDDNVSAIPYQFRVSGELSGLNAMLDGLPSSVGRPMTYRDIRIDAPAGAGLVFGVRLVMTGVVDIWVYTGNRAVAPEAEPGGEPATPNLPPAQGPVVPDGPGVQDPDLPDGPQPDGGEQEPGTPVEPPEAS